MIRQADAGPLSERWIKCNIDRGSSGLYAWLNPDGSCEYFGMAANLLGRSLAHWRKWASEGIGANPASWQLMTFPVPPGLRTEQVERSVILTIRPPRNKQFHAFRGTTHERQLSEIIADSVKACSPVGGIPHPAWCRLCAEERSVERVEQAQRDARRRYTDYYTEILTPEAFRAGVHAECTAIVADFPRRIIMRATGAA